MKRFCLILFLFPVLGAFLSLPVMGADYYVNSSVTDPGDGSLSSPWKTITEAAGKVPAGTAGSPNLIHVAAGNYDAAGGEIFPIHFDRDYVSLIGAATGIVRLEGQGEGTTDNLLVVDNNDGINDIVIRNITFAGANEGVLSYNGGISLIDNIFESSLNEGLHVGIDTSSEPLSTSFTVAKVVLSGNEFNCARAGAYIYVSLQYSGTSTGHTATLGGIRVNNNIFNIPAEQIGLDIPTYSVSYMNSGTITFGEFSVSDNIFNGGNMGLSFNGSYASLNNSALFGGNFIISNNNFVNQAEVGIYIEYVIGPAGTAIMTADPFLIKDNSITATHGQSGLLIIEDIDDGVSYGTPEVSSNTISGFYRGIDVGEGDLYGGFAGARIQGNDVSGNVIGLSFQSKGTGYTVFCNSFTGNSSWGLAVDNGFAAVINAENNWWGSPAGPGDCPSCNKVNPGDLGNVDYMPWLKKIPEQSTICGGGFPWPMFLPIIINNAQN